MPNQLSLEKRTVSGKKLDALRAEGQIPSVVYGGEMPIMTTSNYNQTDKVLREVGYHSPLQLDIDGRAQLAIVKSVDVDPVSRRIRNIEFQAVSADDVVTATAPIKVVGYDESEAAKKHYALMQTLDDVEVKAQPTSLPNEILVDGSRLAEIGDRLTLADLQLPNGVALADQELAAETVVASVYEATSESEEEKTDESPAESGETPEA